MYFDNKKCWAFPTFQPCTGGCLFLVLEKHTAIVSNFSHYLNVIKD